MKLQIDATVIYAITKGQYNLKRKLLFKDLKIDHPSIHIFIMAYRQNPFHMWKGNSRYNI